MTNTMPFPLLSLPYGFRRRLFELSTPFEAYSIQVAAPNFTSFRQPVTVTTLSCNTSFLQLDGVSNQFYNEFDKPVAKEQGLRTLGYGMQARDLKNNDLIFNNFIFSHAGLLSFERCHIDMAFLTKMRSNLSTEVTNKPEYAHSFFKLLDCTYAPDVTTNAICESVLKHFRYITWSPFPVSSDGLSGVLNSNLSSVRTLTVGLTSLNLLDIDPNTLLNFFLARRSGFDLEFEFLFDKPKSDIETKVTKMLSSNFLDKQSVDVSFFETLRLYITYSDESRCYYLIK